MDVAGSYVSDPHARELEHQDTRIDAGGDVPDHIFPQPSRIVVHEFRAFQEDLPSARLDASVDAIHQGLQGRALPLGAHLSQDHQSLIPGTQDETRLVLRRYLDGVVRHLDMGEPHPEGFGEVLPGDLHSLVVDGVFEKLPPDEGVYVLLPVERDLVAQYSLLDEPGDPHGYLRDIQEGMCHGEEIVLLPRPQAPVDHHGHPRLSRLG